MKDKIVWITGASSGIGDALAYRYHHAGAKLIISSRNHAELLRVKANCKNAPDVEVLTLDLEQTDSLAQKAAAGLSTSLWPVQALLKPKFPLMH